MKKQREPKTLRDEELQDIQGGAHGSSCQDPPDAEGSYRGGAGGGPGPVVEGAEGQPTVEGEPEAGNLEQD